MIYAVSRAIQFALVPLARAVGVDGSAATFDPVGGGALRHDDQMRPAIVAILLEIGEERAGLESLAQTLMDHNSTAPPQRTKR